MIKLNQKTSIRKIERMNNRQISKKTPNFLHIHAGETERPSSLVPELAAGGQPSTWLPPGGLVEHYLAKKLNYNGTNHHRIHSTLF